VTTAALDGFRVVEIGHHVAAPYAGRLLADLGAEVVKIERPGGDPLRARHSGALFDHLNAGKRSIEVDLASPAGREAALALVAGAGIVLENLRAGALERLGLGPAELAAANPAVAVVRISNFGQTGPSRDLPVTDLTLQAAGGWVSVHGDPDGVPVMVGGRMAEHLGGTYAACAALTAHRWAAQTGRSVVVDLSIQECLVGTLPYPMLFFETLQELGYPTHQRRLSVIPGIVPCRDGWVGINALTGQHWSDICAATGLPQWDGRQQEVLGGGDTFKRFRADLQGWLDERTTTEIVELFQAMRIPAAPIANGATLPELEQLVVRRFFRPGERGALRPGPPYRLSRTPAAPA